MENKNALILGLIKRVLEYGDIADDISIESLEPVFGEQHQTISTQEQVSSESDFDELEFLRMQLDSQMLMTQMISQQLIELEAQKKDLPTPIAKTGELEEPFYQYIYEKLCTEESAFKELLTDISLAKLNKKCSYGKFTWASRKMGLTLLCAASYKGTLIPTILMGAFMRMAIDRIFDTESTTHKYRYQPDSFNKKISELFDEANQADFSLAICAVEPMWAKMFFYTNEMPMYYVANEQITEFSKEKGHYKHPNTKAGYKEFSIDYVKNGVFYLPTFATTEGSDLENLGGKLQQVIKHVHRQSIDRQKQEIQASFENITEAQAELLAGDSILIFKI